LGELVVRCALAEAKAEWLPLRLWVLRNNPARHLYQRLGFRRTKTIYKVVEAADEVPGCVTVTSAVETRLAEPACP
jgi:ribosomal protein S18 acetylase RimI-like enzyme